MCSFSEIGVIVNRAIGSWILDECTKNCVVEFETRVIADFDLDTERFRARLDNSDRLRMTIIGHEESFPIRNDCVTKRHRLGGGCGFVQQRRICDIKCSQIHDHLLKIQQRLESALRDFRLVRCIGGVPTGIFQNVPLDDRRRNAIVIAGAHE